LRDVRVGSGQPRAPVGKNGGHKGQEERQGNSECTGSSGIDRWGDERRPLAAERWWYPAAMPTPPPPAQRPATMRGEVLSGYLALLQLLFEPAITMSPSLKKRNALPALTGSRCIDAQTCLCAPHQQEHQVRLRRRPPQANMRGRGHHNAYPAASTWSGTANGATTAAARPRRPRSLRVHSQHSAAGVLPCTAMTLTFLRLEFPICAPVLALHRAASCDMFDSCGWMLRRPGARVFFV
jgi:hypothetical protein